MVAARPMLAGYSTTRLRFDCAFADQAERRARCAQSPAHAARRQLQAHAPCIQGSEEARAAARGAIEAEAVCVRGVISHQTIVAGASRTPHVSDAERVRSPEADSTGSRS